jgi:hypothetical protein
MLFIQSVADPPYGRSGVRPPPPRLAQIDPQDALDCRRRHLDFM